MKRICVFCGSNPGKGRGYRALATKLGHALAERGLGLVYGGGNVGLMGTIADAVLERGGKLASELQSGKELDDVTLLREVMNTVGKFGQLGGSIRCVVSVSMLTEGWDEPAVSCALQLP